MGFFIRKALNFGPIRINVNKNGVGASFGVKGARIGVDSKGRSYVAGGREGIYYKEYLPKDIPQSHSFNTDTPIIKKYKVEFTDGTTKFMMAEQIAKETKKSVEEIENLYQNSEFTLS